MTQPVSVIRTPSVWPFIGTPWSSSTSSGGTSGIVVVLDVVVEVVVGVGGAVVVVIDGKTDSITGVVTSVGARSTEDGPHAATRRLPSTATLATLRIKDRLASGSIPTVDHPPSRRERPVTLSLPAARGLDLLGCPQMLQHIDSALESFLRTSIGLDARDVDVAFDPPDREWGGSLNRPTLNLFLWSINRNTDRDLAGQRATQVDGRTVYANAPVPIELRYLVTAWSADHEDEKQLLGSTLAAVVSHRAISTDHYPRELDGLPAAELALSGTGAEQQADLWNALDGQLKPGIQVTIQTVLPGEAPTPAGAPVESLATRITDPATSRASATRRIAGIARFEGAEGLLVQAPHASTTINAVGRFAVRAEAGDELVILSDPPRRVIVPEAGGVVVD